MCIAIAGGVKSIERDYIQLSKKYGLKCKTFNQNVPDFTKKIKNVDAIIIFTGTVSHKMAGKCRKICRKNNICLKKVHSNSVNQLEKAIIEIIN